MRRFAALVLLSGALLCPARARAQQLLEGSQAIAFDRPESWAMKYYTSVTLFTSFGPPRPLGFGALRIAIEGQWIPDVSESQRVVGFDGTKAEDLNKLPAIGRLRFTFGLPWKLSLTLSYLPPIPINKVQADLFSISLGRPFRIYRGLVLGLVVYGQVGEIEGPFTCPLSAVNAGSDPQKNPFGCLALSSDEVDANYLGLEGSASYRIAQAHGLEPYVTAAVNYLNLGFNVNARYDGVIDRTRLTTDGATFSMTGGLLFPITTRLDLAAEVFYSPLTVKRPNRETTVEGLFNVRAMIAYRFF